MYICKKLFPLCLMLFLALQNPAAHSAAGSTVRTIDVNVNGEFVATGTSPFISAGRVMIPVRALAPLGLSYSWDSGTHTAVITNPAGDTFKMTQGQRTAYKNTKPVEMDTEANNYNGRLMLPARFVSEAFGYSVFYETTRAILFVTSKDYAPDPAKFTSAQLHEARLAAISLPITYDFPPSPDTVLDKKRYYTYTFAANDASKYTYENGRVTTVVEINNHKAKAVWQFSTGGIPGYSLYETLGGREPAYMPEMLDDSFHYSEGIFKAFHKLEDGSYKSFTYRPRNYGDIIQPIPAE
ncbi:copper amine oxidase N-terminal domain-containing protein [Paenibacillus sp. CN-4]|uniref:copper amine oxidase N-terminal domain-containing protein n=1 Tax=Paenibacillus nanchangensis TaxID=3348343 RepID=UPI00397D01B1